eukprot:gene16013-22150_t
MKELTAMMADMLRGKKEEEDIASMMSSIREVAKAAKRREAHGLLPVMRGTLPDRMQMKLHHRSQVAKARSDENKTDQGTKMMATTSMLAPITHGVAPQALPGLKPIVLSEAVQKVNMIHAGRVMFLTIVEEAYRTVGTSVIVRDIEGNIMTLNLYNYVPAEVLPRTMIPVDSHIALVEPYLRFVRDDADMPVCMRCDNPQAVHVLSDRRYKQCTVHSDFEWTEEQEVIQVSAAAATKLCEQGNLAFASGRFHEAIGLYNKALRAAPPEDPARARFMCNRGQCHVRKGRWSDALADSEEVLKLDPAYKKSAYCRALALLMLQRPVEAREAAADPLLDSLATCGKTGLRADIERAVREQESGAYDLQALLEESESGVGDASPGCVSQRHCDYESPHIKMVEGSKAKGRCMVADKAILAGTLLMAAKAFVFEPGNIHSLDTVLGEKGHMGAGSSARMLPRVVQALLDRPESSSELYTLSAGPAFDGKPLPGYTGAVDVPRIRGILCNNWFGATEDALWEVIKDQRWEEKSGKLLPPSKRGEQATKRPAPSDSSMSRSLMTGTGLWIRPSLLNHSCLPNCTYFNVGDFMFISTTLDVEAGEELSQPYLDIMKPFEQRTQTLAGWNSGNGFACDCARCSACRRHPKIASLESEMSTMFKRVTKLSATMSMSAAMGIVKAQLPSCVTLERFPDREVCGVLLPQLELEALALELSGKAVKAVPVYQRLVDIRASVLGTLGSAFYVSDNLRLASAALGAGNQSVARQSMLAAFKVVCLPGWHGLPISVPDFHHLIAVHCNGAANQSPTTSILIQCIQLAVEADAATGHLAIQKSPAFCAYCVEEAPKMLRYGKCDELYCSKEHQKAHWKIHKKRLPSVSILRPRLLKESMAVYLMIDPVTGFAPLQVQMEGLGKVLLARQDGRDFDEEALGDLHQYNSHLMEIWTEGLPRKYPVALHGYLCARALPGGAVVFVTVPAGAGARPERVEPEEEERGAGGGVGRPATRP